MSETIQIALVLSLVYVVCGVIAHAREELSIEWLAEKAFGDKAWPRARDWRPRAEREAAAAARTRPPAHASRRAAPDSALQAIRAKERAAAAERAETEAEFAAAKALLGIAEHPAETADGRAREAVRRWPARAAAIGRRPDRQHRRRETRNTDEKGNTVNKILAIATLLMLASCERTDVAAANQSAREFVRNIPGATGVTCAEVDTDGDGYVSCTVFRGSQEPMQIQCGAERRVWWNCSANCARGCKYMPSVKLNGRAGAGL